MDTLQMLWTEGVLGKAIWETVYMVFLSTLLSYVIGLPLGLILTVTDKNVHK